MKAETIVTLDHAVYSVQEVKAILDTIIKNVQAKLLDEVTDSIEYYDFKQDVHLTLNDANIIEVEFDPSGIVELITKELKY